MEAIDGGIKCVEMQLCCFGAQELSSHNKYLFAWVCSGILQFCHRYYGDRNTLFCEDHYHYLLLVSNTCKHTHAFRIKPINRHACQNRNSLM